MIKDSKTLSLNSMNFENKQVKIVFTKDDVNYTSHNTTNK